uniref:Uncharacterized protein n=1 Tax=viral metagenome TaxID=1070528 RepID=A0A6C0KV99_9ZZZZ
MLPKIKSLSELDYILNDIDEKQNLEKLSSKSFNCGLTKFQKEIKKEIQKEIINPKQYGLEKSPRIIPSYYLKNGNLLHIDFYEVIKDDIRNSRKLNEYQLKYIKTLNEERKIEIIELFNDCNAILVSLMNDIL